jgi:hypothetical protein
MFMRELKHLNMGEGDKEAELNPTDPAVGPDGRLGQRIAVRCGGRGRAVASTAAFL